MYGYVINTMEYYLAIKKNGILLFAMTWIELECITLSEISQSEKDKYRMISLLCGIQETTQMRDALGAQWLSVCLQPRA